MATKRRVTRKVKYSTSPASKFQRFLASFKPSNFKQYWLSPEGLRRLGKIAGFGFLFLVLVFLFFAKDLPSPSKINGIVGAQTTKFYDRTGNTLLYEVYGSKNRSVIAFDQMPENIKNATVAVEDRNFYRHGAFSVLGILRSATVDAICRCVSQGGSTITQQYVKNALLSDNRSISRKIKELILSIEIESFYSKNDILKLYLNEIPYGSNSYGIQAASKAYFSKDAKDLTLDEAAFLAAIPRAPTYYSPYGNHVDTLKARKNLILDLMAQQKYITQAQADTAKAIDTQAKISPVQNLYANITAPHFVLWVQDQLEAKYGTKTVTEGGLKIITTLDMDQQRTAEKAIADNMKTVRSLGGSNAAFVSADPKTGQILSMVGSYNFSDPKFGAYNVATADRQPGSSFKPFVYSTAFGQNYGPGTTIYDVPTDFGGGYKPQNFGNKSYGVLSMRQALGGSLNIPAVKTLYMAGIQNALNTAHKLGITTLNDSPDQYGLSLTLGSGEVKLVDMVNAYQSFANGGVHYAPVYALKVSDSKGSTLEEFKPKTPSKVLDPQVAYLISNILSDNPNRAFVFGNILAVAGHTVAVKTGTTEHYNDAWTVGYTPSVVAGVWAGNNDNAPMSQAAAAISVPIWHDFMVKTLAGKADEPFVRPSGIKEVTLDANTGKLANDQSKVKRTDIFPSWYKPQTAADSKSAKIDKVSGKLATDCTPPLAQDTAFSSEVHAEIPANDPAYGRWEPPVQALAATLGYKQGGNLPTDSDDVHHCGDSKPQVSLTATSLGGGTYHLKAVVTSGTFTANALEIRLDDQIISTQQINGSTSYEFDNTIDNNGGHTYKATVTDTALYQGEDSETVTVTDAGSGASFQGQTPNGSHHGSLVVYTWSSYPGSGITYQLYVDGSATGAPTPGLSQAVNGTSFGLHSWYVKALNGSTVLGTTSTINYTNLP